MCEKRGRAYSPRDNGLPETAIRSVRVCQMLPIPAVDIWSAITARSSSRIRDRGLAHRFPIGRTSGATRPSNDPTSVQMTELPTVASSSAMTWYWRQDRHEGGNRICNGDGVLLVNRTLECSATPVPRGKRSRPPTGAALGVTKVIGLNGRPARATWQANREAPIPYFTPTKSSASTAPSPPAVNADEFCQFAAPPHRAGRVTEREAAGDPIMAAN